MSNFVRTICLSAMMALSLAATSGVCAEEAAPASTQPSEETWNSIKGDIFQDRPILDGSGLVTLEAPRRAEDAAIVPIGMRVNLPAGDKRSILSLTLVIDENPAPVAGKFTIGAHSGVTSDFHTRSGEYLFLCPRGCGAERRPTLRSEILRQGVRRLFGAGRVECRRRQIDARPNEVPHLSTGGRWVAGGSDHAAAPAELGIANGPGDALVRAALLYRDIGGLAGSRISCCRWTAASRSRRIRTSASTIGQTAPRIFA